MSLRIFDAQSVSAAPVVHFMTPDSKGGKTSVSAGLSGETTFFLETIANDAGGVVPIYGRYVIVTANGTWADGSGAAALGIDYSPNASSGVWVNIASVSGAFTSVYPVTKGDALRFRNVVTGSAASSSVDLFVS